MLVSIETQHTDNNKNNTFSRLPGKMMLDYDERKLLNDIGVVVLEMDELRFRGFFF